MLATLKGKQLYVTLWFNQRTVSLQIICIYVKYSVQLLCFHRRRTNAKNESERNNIEIFGKKQSPNTVVANATEMKVQQHAAQWKTWQLSFASLYLAVKMHGYYFTSMTLVVEYQFWARDHPYITSAKGLGGWDQKNGNFCWCSEKWQFLLMFSTIYADLACVQLVNIDYKPAYPSKPTRRQRPKAVGGASERSERGRSALFKN